MTLPLSSIMSIGERLAAPGSGAVYVMSVNVTDPKLARVGGGAPTTVGSSSIHSAEVAGPEYGNGAPAWYPAVMSLIERSQFPPPAFSIDANMESPGVTGPISTDGW